MSNNVCQSLKKMLLVCHETSGSKNFFDAHSFKKKFYSQIYYPSYAHHGEQSKLLVLSSAYFFSCCFGFFYPLSSAQVSLDCATQDHQINR